MLRWVMEGGDEKNHRKGETYEEIKILQSSQPIEIGIPLWPWVGQMQDLIIERMLYHERDGKQSAVFHCKMHTSTHMDAPFHVIGTGEGMDEIPLSSCFGTGVVVDMRYKEMGLLSTRISKKLSRRLKRATG